MYVLILVDSCLNETIMFINGGGMISSPGGLITVQA